MYAVLRGVEHREPRNSKAQPGLFRSREAKRLVLVSFRAALDLAILLPLSNPHIQTAPSPHIPPCCADLPRAPLR